MRARSEDVEDLHVGGCWLGESFEETVVCYSRELREWLVMGSNSLGNDGPFVLHGAAFPRHSERL
jgi:hypothetical protein